jgi:tetratricopeptide (TPR) repeat protein
MDKSINQETPSLPRITSQTIAFVARQKWAEFYYGQGNYEAVIRLLDPVAGETASALDGPTRAKSLAILGSAYSRAEQWDKAGTVFEQAAELDSEYPAYKRNTAEAWVSAGRFDQALQQLQAIDPKTANDWFVLALTIFNIQAGTEATPALWATFDQAIAEAKKGNVPGRMILSGQPEVKDWQVRQLELLSLIARAAPEVVMNRGGYLKCRRCLADRVPRFVAKAAGEFEFLGENAGREQQMAEERLVGGDGFAHAGNELFWNDQKMDRSLGLDVVQDDAEVVLVLDLGGDFTIDDALEDCFWHGRKLRWERVEDTE